MPKRITDLPYVNNPASNDPILIVDISTGETSYTTRLDLLRQAIDNVDIKDGAVTEEKLGLGAVTTAKIATGAVTNAKDVIATAHNASYSLPANNTWYNLPSLSGTMTTTGGPLLIMAQFSGYKATNNGNVRYGITIDGVGYRPASWFFFFNDFNTHRRTDYTTILTSIGPGAHTFTMQAYTDAVNYFIDQNDPHQLTILEMKK